MQGCVAASPAQPKPASWWFAYPVLWTEILTKLWKILAVGESKIAMVSSFERQKRTDWRLAKVVMDETGCDLCGGEH